MTCGSDEGVPMWAPQCAAASHGVRWGLCRPRRVPLLGRPGASHAPQLQFGWSGSACAFGGYRSRYWALAGDVGKGLRWVGLLLRCTETQRRVQRIMAEWKVRRNSGRGMKGG